MNILITGGAGYIGSHCCLELLNEGHDIVVIDNLSNSSYEAISRVEKLAGKSIPFYKSDLRDKFQVEKIFKTHPIDAVIHFAGLKAVGESVKNPINYYNNNNYSTLILLEVMSSFSCKKIIFSSSATVYGDSNKSPIKENCKLSPNNPYGTSKLFIELMLGDIFLSDRSWDIVILRYFNPVGAHKSGQIGENPNGTPNNLMPIIAQVAIGKRASLNIFGKNYDTHDGTGVRDYIHVVDLVSGHIKALAILNELDEVVKINLGTGEGYSVLEVLEAFKSVSGRKIPYELTHPRSGDVAQSFADVSLAKKILNWKAKSGLDDMCLDYWNFQLKNPKGYKK